MYYQYIAYTSDKQITKGTQIAADEEVAAKILSGHGYKVLSIKPVPSFLPRWDHFIPSLSRIPVESIITFTRQLALLHESGIGIVTALELLKLQTTNGRFKSVLGDVVTSLRKGEKLSQAMSKHPTVFSRIYVQSVNVGEQTGGIETVLRQMADYMEKENRASKSVKNAMKYPAIVVVAAIIVIAILTIFVLPAFISLYSSLGAELPAITRAVISFVGWFSTYGIYVLGVIVIIGLAMYTWGRTAEGRLQRDKLALKLPLLGRVIHLNELIRCCRSMSILYKAGVPVPEIILLAIDTSNNLVIKQALIQVHQDVLKGEGLSRPMAKSEMFLPMMVQMAGVGEATGNLDGTLMATAESYETEAEDRMRSIIGLIQPTITIILGLVVGVIALSMISAMYSIYGQAV